MRTKVFMSSRWFLFLALVVSTTTMSLTQDIVSEGGMEMNPDGELVIDPKRRPGGRIKEEHVISLEDDRERKSKKYKPDIDSVNADNDIFKVKLIGDIYYYFQNGFFATLVLAIIYYNSRLGELFDLHGYIANLKTGSKSKRFQVEESTLTYSDVIGTYDAKSMADTYFRNLEAGKSGKGGDDGDLKILLYGPPGIGKTLFVRALAGKFKYKLIHIGSSELMDIDKGSGVEQIKLMFSFATKVAPCIVFIDEIDSIAKSRSGLTSEGRTTLNTLLTELDGFNSNKRLCFIVATNSMKDIDKAFIRSGRFGNIINLFYPKYEERIELLNLYYRKYGKILRDEKGLPVSSAEKLLYNDYHKELALHTPLLTGSDASYVYNEVVVTLILNYYIYDYESDGISRRSSEEEREKERLTKGSSSKKKKVPVAEDADIKDIIECIKNKFTGGKDELAVKIYSLLYQELDKLTLAKPMADIFTLACQVLMYFAIRNRLADRSLGLNCFNIDEDVIKRILNNIYNETRDFIDDVERFDSVLYYLKSFNDQNRSLTYKEVVNLKEMVNDARVGWDNNINITLLVMLLENFIFSCTSVHSYSDLKQLIDENTGTDERVLKSINSLYDKMTNVMNKGGEELEEDLKMMTQAVKMRVQEFIPI